MLKKAFLVIGIVLTLTTAYDWNSSSFKSYDITGTGDSITVYDYQDGTFNNYNVY